MKVKPKLYLNMSPQTAEDGSLAFARNMKIDDDGNLVSDYGYKNISAMANYNIVGHIVGLDNKIYFFCHTNDVSKIVEYDEVEETATELTTTWTYSGGEIDGYVNTNQSGEKILTIGEYLDNGSEIPLKHINLKFSNVEQSLYSQAPECPTANLVLTNTYVKTIPNGVYVFFIRYKIRKDVYTNWFLCSRPIFGGTSEKITTLQGGLSYINLHKDSAKSFVFHLDFAQTANIDSYKEFQLGFIITHDEATDARMWKHFNMTDFSASGGNIYFDYEDISEANIDDLLETTYELYNVRNVTAFKNKLYISNYIESNFNPDGLNALANCISLTEVHSGGTNNNYKNLKLNNVSLAYNNSKGYYDSKEGGGSILSILTKDSFNYSVTKLAKESTKEKNELVKFNLIWDGQYDPDIAFVYNIYNYAYDKQVFGPDFAAEYAGNNEALGITQAAHENNLWVYIRSSTPHPWDKLGLTFAFGSFSKGETGKAYARQGCSYFNKFSFGQWGIRNILGWVTRDSGFGDAAINAMTNKLKEDIKSKSFWGKVYLEVISGANVYTIGYQDRMALDNYIGYGTDITELSDSLFSTDTLSYKLRTYIEGWVYNVISDSNIFRGIDENGTPIIIINDKEIRVNSIVVKFKKFEFSLEDSDVNSSNSKLLKNFNVNLKTTDYTSLCTFVIKSSALSVTNTAGSAIQASTLMPLSTYQPYVHFVDEHNIITNGVKLPKFTTSRAQSDKDIITLNYSISNLPTNKYKSWFISLVNVGDIIIEGFDYTKDPNNNNTNIIHTIELDSMLYNLNDNITIKGIVPGPQGDQLVTITDKAKYYSSGSSYPPLAFGNCGYVAWDGPGPTDATRIYIVITRNKSFENINKLTKSSSYIPLVNTDSTPLPDGYYGSWLCLVKKPSFTLSSSCYVSGKDVYSVDRTTALSLSEFKNFIQVQDSVTYFVRSNFNLNYLSLTEDITDSIFTVGAASAGVKQVAKVINSAILSFIYELKSMYKDFSNKSFRRFDSDYKIDFDNTVRVSHVLSDETFNNSIFKFSAEDYYNVPTDRGAIVNLFAIGNNIFVHTKTSFYKFDGNQTIAASDKDITLQESEPFENGVTQLFDSEYGYGGINNKEAGCITFDSYIFYDAMSNHIFAYGGNSQVQIIDASIYKMLCYYKPTYCRTLHDDANHRVLFEFTTDKTAGIYKTFTISYNYKSKSFVSLHDLSLINAFHSRYISYSYKSGLISLFNETATIDNTPLVQDMNIYKIYGNATTVCFIQFGANTQDVQSSPFNIAVVVFPQESYREVFNNLKYIGDIVKDNYDEKTNYEVIKFSQVSRTNPVSKFYVITDRCVSTPVTGDVNDEQRPANPDDYKSFKYDMGSWNTNYFRNALNDNNVYKYPNQSGVNVPIAGGQTYTRYPNTDNNSLVYGKYFILVFDFIKNRPIKFEEVSVNSNQY